MSTFFLSSVESIAQAVNANPALKNVPFFNNLKPYLDAIGSKSCCGKAGVLQQYRGNFEKAIVGMDDSSANLIKKAMKVDQICWYVKNSKGQLEKRCK